jgi:hypothetical protein
MLNLLINWLLAHGYGSYGISVDTGFVASRFRLIDLGFIFCAECVISQGLGSTNYAFLIGRLIPGLSSPRACDGL